MATGHTILTIEDNPELQTVYMQMLGSHGYKVIQAMDGEEGLELARKKKPDLIVLDILLPKKNGFEVLEQLKAKAVTASIPVIISSYQSADEDVKRGLGLGADAYLIKGHWNQKMFIDTITKILT